MTSYIRRFLAFLLVAIFVLGTIPANAKVLPIEDRNDTETAYTVEEMCAENDMFWQKIEPQEKKLVETKADRHTFMQEIYNLIEKQDNIYGLKWDDDDTFSFRFSKGMGCVYDYDMRMAEMKGGHSIDTVEVIDFRTKSGHTTSCSNTFVFGPYYGEDDSFTDYYRNLGADVASAKGGTCTVYSGSQATPARVRAAFAQANTCAYFIDTHGTTTQLSGMDSPSSYVAVAYNTTGVTSYDITSCHIISVGGGAKLGIDGYFITNYGNTVMPDAFVWIAACQSMMTYGLGYPMILSGAGGVLGYSQSVSFTSDYKWSEYFWDYMFDGHTVAESAAYMKTRWGVNDKYTSPRAYPVFMWDDGSGNALSTYPANPDATQNVTSDWKLINNDPTYTVTFRDWDNTVLSQQTVYQGEDAQAPANPAREGYTFTGWDTAYTNVQSNLTITAQYQIKTYTVTFADWNGTTLKTQTVEHGSAAQAPANPTRANYTFTGWDVAFNNITSDLTVTAQYVKTICTVTFVDWNGTTLKTEQVAGGGSATAPADPERTGYNFVGWDRAFDYVTDDITVTALYQQISITVRFVNWDGTLLKTYEAAYGALPEAPLSVPARTGYTFTGWSPSVSNPVYEDTTFTAQFTINTYDVYFIDSYSGHYAVLKTEQVNHGANATPPASPTRPGYRFTGWDKSYTNVQSTLYVYAVYEEVVSPQLSIATVTGRAGNTVDVQVRIAQNPGIDEISFTIAYDTSKLTYVSSANGSVMSNMNVSGNTFTFTNASSTSTNGVLVTITFNIASGLATGVNIPVTFTAHSVTSGGVSVLEETANGSVIVNNTVIGDVDCSGEVNTRDAVLLLRYLAGMMTAQESEIFDANAADINRNGNITTQDVVYILKYVAEDHSVDHFFIPSES